MNIYLAADYARKDEMRGCRDVLVALGYNVTSRWIDNPDEVEGHGTGGVAINDANRLELAVYAAIDYQDIIRCDAFIQFTTGELTRGGRQVEFGLAKAEGKTLYIIGPREHVFHCAADVHHYPTWRSFVIDFSRGWREARATGHSGGVQ